MQQIKTNYGVEIERSNDFKPRYDSKPGFWLKCFKCGRITHGWDNIIKAISITDIRLIVKGRQNYICPNCKKQIDKIFLNVVGAKVNIKVS